MGLNEMYTAVRGNILMMNTLPSMAQAFAILSQGEKQREVKPYNHTALDSTSLNAYGQNPSRGFKTNYSPSRGGGTSSGNTSNNTGFRGNSTTSRASLFCDYCKKSGHTKDRCYKLHRYPSNPNPRFQKGKGTGSAANVCAPDMNGVQSKDESEVRRQMPLNLSKDQYEQLLNLLGTLQVGNGASNSDNSNSMLNGAVNLADSGASHHMTYDKTTLTNIKSLPYPFLISLPNGYKVKVTEIGDVCLNPALTLRKGPSLKSPLELGKAKNGLYFLCSKCHNCYPSAENKPPRLPHFNCHLVPFFDNIDKISNSKVYTSSSVKHSPINKEDCIVASSSCLSDACPSFANISNHRHDDELLWHARLGHVFPFAIAPDGSSFNSIAQMFIHATDMTCMPGQMNTFTDDDMLDILTPHEVTNNQIISNTNMNVIPSAVQPEPTNNLPSPNISNDPLPAPRRTTRPIHTPTYLNEYNYTLPKLHSLTSFMSHEPICFTSLCSDSQQLVTTISHDCEPTSFEEAILHPAWQQAMTQEFEALYANDT
ncbi:hypothetical protein KY289_026015 [Solanum tuberosum]|nr:hypothetical protein KY289_026015 [Solanum tuberosum]KAH0720687.1 hypothetical protein KY284_005717 [Solanum tuberosum]KAH0720698.1 hypothetical protein KY284_005728 [Solanum tuberosum]